MLFVICWVVFGLVVGLISKAIYPAEDFIGFLPTVGLGILGSFVGGGIHWLFNMGGSFHAGGFVWSIVGAVVFSWIYRRYRLNRFFQAQGRMPLYKPTDLR